MRGKGINYDTGAYPAGHPTRERFDPAVVREEMRVIAAELHCTAVRITGGDPDRLDVAARAAATAGLAVWYAPFPCELATDAMLALFTDCARRAESLRRQGNEVVLVLGGELSIMASGPRADLDLASYGVVRIGPDGERRPKAAFHALAEAYGGRVVGGHRSPAG